MGSVMLAASAALLVLAGCADRESSTAERPAAAPEIRKTVALVGGTLVNGAGEDVVPRAAADPVVAGRRQQLWQLVRELAEPVVAAFSLIFLAERARS